MLEPNLPVLQVPARSEGTLEFGLDIPSATEPGTYILTADIRSEGMELPRWTEAVISVVEPQ